MMIRFLLVLLSLGHPHRYPFYSDVWERFEVCFAMGGPDHEIPELCECHDFNEDGHIDLLDASEMILRIVRP